MSYYQNYKFVSPESIYAVVKEELQSYFAAGMCSDILFPKHTQRTLQKLGHGTKPVHTKILEIKNYTAPLPENFFKARQVHFCHQLTEKFFLSPAATYLQRVEEPCDPLSCHQVIKSTVETRVPIMLSHLLRPVSTATWQHLDPECSNLWATSADTFYIDAGYIFTSFPSGLLYLLYYADTEADCEILIPDLVEFQDYLKAYLIFKCFESLLNGAAAENYRQLQDRFLYYKTQAEEHYLIVKAELMKRSVYQVADAIKKQQERFREYEI